MDKLIDQLCSLNFTKTEAAVYISLITHQRLSGYKIAKTLNLSRSTVYSALDNLYQRGYIYLLPGNCNEYEPKDPETLISGLKKEYLETTDSVKEQLIALDKKPSDNRFLNIEGYANIVAKAKELLLEAECEVYLNTDFDLKIFTPEFQLIHNRGVRIIVFSFVDLVVEDLPIEFYSYRQAPTLCSNTRLMLVIDYNQTLIANHSDGPDFLGTFSRNKLLTQIVSEHIHHDIYLLRLKKKFGWELIDGEIQINTLMEKEGDG